MSEVHRAAAYTALLSVAVQLTDSTHRESFQIHRDLSLEYLRNIICSYYLNWHSVVEVKGDMGKK